MNLKKISLFVILCGCIYGAFQFSEGRIDIQQVFDYIEALGFWAPVLYVGAYILISGFLVPSVVFKVFAGAAFGVVNGLIIASVAAAISSLIKFLLARYFFQDSFLKKIHENARLNAISHVIERDGWKMLIMLRNVPVVSGMFLNYICGVTKMRSFDFVTASFIGRLPQTFVLAYLGYLLGYTVGLEQSAGENIVAQWAMFGVGLMATLGACYYAFRLYKRVLAREEALELGV